MLHWKTFSNKLNKLDNSARDIIFLIEHLSTLHYISARYATTCCPSQTTPAAPPLWTVAAQSPASCYAPNSSSVVRLLGATEARRSWRRSILQRAHWAGKMKPIRKSVIIYTFLSDLHVPYGQDWWFLDPYPPLHTPIFSKWTIGLNYKINDNTFKQINIKSRNNILKNLHLNYLS